LTLHSQPQPPFADAFFGAGLADSDPELFRAVEAELQRQGTRSS
jgi:hypothetical protein